jgi:hypothetical protein
MSRYSADAGRPVEQTATLAAAGRTPSSAVRPQSVRSRIATPFGDQHTHRCDLRFPRAAGTATEWKVREGSLRSTTTCKSADALTCGSSQVGAFTCGHIPVRGALMDSHWVASRVAIARAAAHDSFATIDSGSSRIATPIGTHGHTGTTALPGSRSIALASKRHPFSESMISGVRLAVALRSVEI